MKGGFRELDIINTIKCPDCYNGYTIKYYEYNMGMTTFTNICNKCFSTGFIKIENEDIKLELES